MNRVTYLEMVKGEIYYIEIVGQTLLQLQSEYPGAKGRYRGKYGGMYERIFDLPLPLPRNSRYDPLYRGPEIPIRDLPQVEFDEKSEWKYQNERESEFPPPTCYKGYIYTWKFLPIDGVMGIGHEYFRTNVYNNKKYYPYATYGKQDFYNSVSYDSNKDIIYYKPSEPPKTRPDTRINLFSGFDSMVTTPNSFQGESQDLPGGELPIPVTEMIIGHDYLIEVKKIKGNVEFNKEKKNRKVSGYLIGTYKGPVKKNITDYAFCNLREIYDYMSTSYSDMIPSGVIHDGCIVLSLLDFSVFPVLTSPPRGLYREGVQYSIKNGPPSFSSFISSLNPFRSRGKLKRKSKHKSKHKSKRKSKHKSKHKSKRKMKQNTF